MEEAERPICVSDQPIVPGFDPMDLLNDDFGTFGSENYSESKLEPLHEERKKRWLEKELEK